MHRIKQHNGKAPGGPQDTKRAAGYWRLMFYMRIPPIRNFSCRELVIGFNKKRGLASRCKMMLKFALSIRVEYKISKILLVNNSEYYSKKIEDILRSRYSEKDLDELLME